MPNHITHHRLPAQIQKRSHGTRTQTNQHGSQHHTTERKLRQKLNQAHSSPKPNALFTVSRVNTSDTGPEANISRLIIVT